MADYVRYGLAHPAPAEGGVKLSFLGRGQRDFTLRNKLCSIEFAGVHYQNLGVGQRARAGGRKCGSAPA
jgi:hypothetical protein